MIAFGLPALPCGDVAAGVVAKDGGSVKTLLGSGQPKVFPELVGHADRPYRVPVVLGHEFALRVCTYTSLAS